MAQLISPTVHTAALAALETALNQALALAPEGAAELARLDDSVFHLACQAPEVDIYLCPGNGTIRLMGQHEGPVTTTVRGVASDFSELATSPDPAATLINGKLTVEGDSAPLLELQRIFAALDPDWEAPLVSTLGDVPGHQLATLLRGVFRWGQQASGSFLRQLEEFIHEEARLCPPRLEIEDFIRDVEELALRTERLQSRTDRLARRLREQKN